MTEKRPPMIRMTIAKPPTPSRPAPVQVEDDALDADAPFDLRLIRAIEFLEKALKDGPVEIHKLVQLARAQRLHRADLKAARVELGIKSVPHPDFKDVRLWKLPQ